MIYINNLSINNDATNINVDITTNVSSIITKVLLWNENTFKDYGTAIDVSFKLEQTSNNEVFIITTNDININSFNGIWFLEITSNYVEDSDCISCQNAVIGIAANLNNIKSYILDRVLELDDCVGCRNNHDNIDNITNLYLINKGICTSLQLGYYEEAIYLYKKLKKLISNVDCISCRKLRDPIYNSNLNFGILDNNLILV